MLHPWRDYNVDLSCLRKIMDIHKRKLAYALSVFRFLRAVRILRISTSLDYFWSYRFGIFYKVAHEARKWG